MEYPKIQTLFNRDGKGVIIPEEYTLEEFKHLENSLWECTEKIDGTNIRIEIEVDSDIRVSFKGRTERAIIPKHLLEYLTNKFPIGLFVEVFDLNEKNPLTITIFGEGYGYKIQKGHNYLDKEVGFILFDVRVGKWWLNRESCEEISSKLGCNIVPLMGYMTILEAIKYVSEGFKSTIANNKDYDAEGLVLKTPSGLLDRSDSRFITKIKTVDFIKYQQQFN